MGASPAPPGADLAGIDLFDAAFHATGDQHAVWARMREHAPVHRQVLPDGRAFWSVTRYADACRVLGDHRRFTSERGSLLHQLGQRDAAAGRMLVSADPPRHQELRRPLNRIFSGQALEDTRSQIRAAVRRLIGTARPGGWDLMDSAVRLPMAVAASILGIPEEDWDDLTRWTGMAAAPADPHFQVGSAAATLAVAHHSIFDYFSQRIRARPHTAGDDLLGQLMTVEAGPARLTREEIVLNCYSVLLGANATTPHAIAGSVLALIDHPEQMARAASDPAELDGLTEEGLRWTSPASSFLRHAVEDVTIAGTGIARDDAVAVWIGAANRDPRQFPDPERFDIGRIGNRHIAFGHGPHYCLGAAMARMTLRVFFEEFLRAFTEIRTAGPPERLASNFIAGFTSLPLSLTPRPGTDPGSTR